VTFLEAMLFAAMMGFAAGMTFLEAMLFGAMMVSFAGLLVGLHGGQ
jgi:hypothetical protein